MFDSFFDANVVMYALLSFICGMLAILGYYKLRSIVENNHKNHSNNNDIEAIISEYKRRLTQYESAITDLRIKIDRLEIRLTNRDSNGLDTVVTSRQISQHPQLQYDNSTGFSTSGLINDKWIERKMIEDNNNNKNNSETLENILRLLKEQPRTSRQIQLAIGRTREHTSRIMKRLYELKLVNRETDHKPYKYNITDVGRSHTGSVD
jgi:hypothetical protein